MVVPRRVGVHVVLQHVLAVPALAGEADRVQAEERPELVPASVKVVKLLSSLRAESRWLALACGGHLSLKNPILVQPFGVSEEHVRARFGFFTHRMARTRGIYWWGG